MVTAAAYHSITLGDIRVIYLPDGYFLFNPRVLFPTTTTADWQFYQHLLDHHGQLVGSIGAYVIQTPDHAVIVDTGYGPRSVEGMVYSGKLLSSLKRAGLDPANIDIVFFTHLHSDHVGWTGMPVKGELIPTFPNARHLLRGSEWHRFDNPAEKRSGIEDALKLLEHRVELVEEGERIIPEVTILATSGHTLGHASLLVTSGQERAILLGDIFHSVAQFEHPEWTNSMDSDHEQAKLTREQMLRELAKPSTIGVGTHFSDSVFGRLTPVKDKLQWQIQQ
ncbi:MBL fold metallo-hydrolase [Ktedonobacter racemifer]|uniref:Metal-dependent hydrolase n=1 Tax=Ktedonobacter racemifer DSM 44963 TaxID=485913 RepID=D6U3L0_KTERA|nr:MBL fold metallo-hydrolase [Ktedonobacter racemifer]EFH83000.1 metal-dependent hydrolase [Ktedonobacter racemifer DSM 44963]